MELVDANNLADYLRRTNRIAPAERVEVRELSGGVSNVVLLVRPALGEAFVVKQARPQLRVPQPWFCGVERVLREIDVLRLCQRVLAARPGELTAGDNLSVLTPRLLFEGGFSSNLEYYTNSYREGIEQPRGTAAWFANTGQLESDLGGLKRATTGQSTQSPARYNWQSAFSYVTGAHNLKTGVQYQRIRSNSRRENRTGPRSNGIGL